MNLESCIESLDSISPAELVSLWEKTGPELERRSTAERSLRQFTKQAWHVVEPKDTLQWGWHIDAICEHLTAVSLSQIRKLIINIPPGHTKSLTVAVFWPAWEWINSPHVRWLFSSYAEKLSKRDSARCRRLIKSPWYQKRWGDRYYIVPDQDEKLRFENNQSGYRIATSTGGVGTGERANRVIADDPNNVRDAESDVKRGETNYWWDEEMSSRLNDRKRDARVIIQQRTHENDLSGHCLARDLGWEHLCLPARYEGEDRVMTSLPPSRAFKARYGTVKWEIREEEDEPLHPERFDDEALTEMEDEMGPYAAAGQLQQRPAPRGGGMFKVEKFAIVPALPPAHFVEASIRYWDKAGTEGGGKRTAGVKMLQMKEDYPGPGFVIPCVIAGQWGSGRREQTIKMTAELDGVETVVWVEQEPGSGGKESAENTIKNLAGFVCKADKVTGSKEVRAEPYAAQLDIGNVGIVKAEWNRMFLDEHEPFPMGKFSDQVDGASGAFNKLNEVKPKKKRGGVWGKEYR